MVCLYSGLEKSLRDVAGEMTLIVTAIATLASAGVPLENQVYILNHWH
jgi:hypothetical protein